MKTEPELSETNRLEAFSDGIFAVAITLLVLDVRLPHPEPERDQLWTALRALLPVVLSWVISFIFVLVIWVNHHYLFNEIRKTDRRLMWINGLLLLGISFIPFPTAVAGQYFLAPPGLFILSLAMFTVSCAFSLLRWYAGFVAHLTHEHLSAARRKRALMRSLIGPFAYAMAAVLSFVWPPGALILQFLVPAWFMLSRAPGAAMAGSRS
jgi:uncharacterized membrane protein